ncbi:hypothetical protein G7Z17_g6306 [Cylindrodendrum hubeiense]|uniref:Cell wall proline rich protein n=1 Tax=Cylindrodendrum hubeiense TaxID=595255 RepID=A0A9P5H7J6_9HYPO|nr:hypothetical protein G7Z17_g6306 [Cylindrodendrum hubeiense]
MATTCRPESFGRPSAGPAFDDNPDHLAASMGSFDASSLGPQHSPRTEIPPNPPFVFPAQPPSPSAPFVFPAQPPSPSAPFVFPAQPPSPSGPFSFPAQPPSFSGPTTFARTTARRPMSAIESPNRSFDLSSENDDSASRLALPAFSFNPGASLPSDRQTSFLLSPPMSPASARNFPSVNRPAGHGHRRGGSEFVGGRLREGNSIAVMSTSPTKSESGFNTPTLQPPRRGHRRGISGAISTNDLPVLHPPVFNNSLGRGSSAPTSPTSFGQAGESVMDSCLDPLPPAAPEPAAKLEEPEHSPKPAEHSSPESSPKQSKPSNKARVGFSDTLEFIPRPLSLVSNETSSTATARPGHSLSGSISSIVSGATPSGRSSPAPIGSMALSRSPTRDPTDSRPSTAGAILERTQDLTAVNSSPRRRNSIPTLIHLAEAFKTEQPEPSPTKTPKRWSFFARDPSTASSSPTKTRPHSSSSSDSVAKASSSEHGSDSAGEMPPAAPVKQKKSGKKNKKKKNKKVKGWAGSILPKKPKGHSKKSKSDDVRPPTPPASTVSPNEEDDFLMEDPELLEPTMPTVTVTESPDLPKEKASGKRSEEESSYPMIDLDAALGPFNTPLPLNPEWEAAQRAAGNVGKRRLHSAQGMKGFSGPGMHYHRRAESAPDLPPFDPGRSGIHRFNSSSTMADVFEEDEEDEYGNSKSKTASPHSDSDLDSEDSDVTPPAALTKDPMLDVQDKMSTHSSVQSMRRTNSSLSDKEQSAVGSVRAERSKSSLHDSIIVEEMPSVIFRSPMFMDRTDTSESSTPSIRRLSGNKDLPPVDIGPIHLPAPANVPNSPYAISHSSSFPSPRSPMSIEVQRISTAPSSITDENNFHSLLMMGEPGPEVRISMDYDIPSLTSSNSTMTRDSMFIPGQRMSQPTMRELRPVSVSSTAFGRRRSSLASLSRLISSSHGERSKLSMEVTLDNEANSKKSKNSRTKRLSRMMQFWKPHHKESASK